METKERILQVARDEFIEKGYKNTSMRSIANSLGITATALYRHYDNKEQIFEAVVGPAVKIWQDFCISEEERETTVGFNEGLDVMWSDTKQSRMIVDILYTNPKEQKLLFFGSEGTKYADFFHELISAEQEATLVFMENLKARGVSVNSIDEKEMHLLLSAHYSTIIDMLRHDFTYDEAMHYADTVTNFFRKGWREFLGF